MALTTNLLAYYKLESDGTDSSGNGYNLSGSNTPSYTSGKVGNCGDFDGAGDLLECANSAFDIYGSQNFSISAWIKIDSFAPSGDTILPISIQQESGDLGVLDKSFKFITGTGNYFYVYGGGVKHASFGTLNTGTWYYLVGTFDGSNIRAYKDGSLISTTPASGSYNHSSPTFRLNAQLVTLYPDEYDHFDGKLDEVGVWTRALSLTEIQTLYNSGDGYDLFPTASASLSPSKRSINC